MAWLLTVISEVIACKEINSKMKDAETALAFIWKVVLNLCLSNMKSIAKAHFSSESNPLSTANWDNLTEQTLPNLLLTVLALHELAITCSASLRCEAFGKIIPRTQ